MAVNAKEIFRLLKISFKDFMDDECPRLAAALSYYTVFALPPLLILLLLIAGIVFDPSDVEKALSGQMGNMLGESGGEAIRTMISQSERPGTGKGVAAVLGIAAVVFGATGAFIQLQAALNRAWEVEPDPRAGGIKNFIFKRLLSLGMVMGIAFLLMVSLAASAVLTALGDMLGQMLPWFDSVFGIIIQSLIELVVFTLLFAGIFKVLPDARIATKDVWVGALVTALLFVIGKIGIGLYLGRSNPGEAYGAAGSLAIVLVWIYYASMILLFGAEFTQTWAVEKGSGIEPEEGARRMKDESGNALMESSGRQPGKQDDRLSKERGKGDVRLS